MCNMHDLWLPFRLWFVHANEITTRRQSSAPCHECHDWKYIGSLWNLLPDRSYATISAYVAPDKEIGFWHVFGVTGLYSIPAGRDGKVPWQGIFAILNLMLSICRHHLVFFDLYSFCKGYSEKSWPTISTVRLCTGRRFLRWTGRRRLHCGCLTIHSHF